MTEQALVHPASALLDALGEGVLLVRGDLTVEYANARWEKWLGAPVEAGTPLSAVFDGERSTAVAELGEFVAAAESTRYHLVAQVKSGDTEVRRLQCSVRRRDTGILIEAREEADLGTHDIARRLSAATDMGEVLRALSEVAAKQCGATGAAVMRVIDREGEVVAATGDLSPARGRSFELAGSMLSEALSEQDVISVDKFAASGRPLMRAVPELPLGPVLAAPLKVHGDSVGVLTVARHAGARPFGSRDVARLRVLADHAAIAVHKSLLLHQAQSADRAKGRFLATMSHELRTPLTALAGYNELLADEVIGPLSESQLDVLERMRSVTAHLSSMIEEILSYTSLEEGREIVRPTEFLVADLAQSAIAVVEPMIDAKKLALELALPDQPVRITGDIDKSRQILVNLLSNAIKFTDQGKVTLRISSTHAAVRLDVIDTGIGIASAELSRLFRPFAQVDSGLTRRHGGTGLGLYISRRIAALLHGHIEVQSTHGVGSTFSVVLPMMLEGRAVTR